jgi:hypothetical protein
MHVNVRSEGVGRVGVCKLCVCDREQRERGVDTVANDITLLVGAGVNTTMLSERIGIISHIESFSRVLIYQIQFLYYETITRVINRRLI